MKRTLLFYTILLSLLTSTACNKQTYPIEVSAGAIAHGSCLMSIPVSNLNINSDETITFYESIKGKEKIIPCQISADEFGNMNLYWLLSGEMPANSKRFYRFDIGKPQTDFKSMKVENTGKELIVKKENRPILAYHYGLACPPKGIDSAFCRSGFIHPAWSPSGKVLTNIQPEDHWHHYGIWNPWTKIVYDGATYDLWNLGDKQGTVAFTEMGDIIEGQVWAGFAAKHVHLIFKANERTSIMNELWKIRAWTIPGSKNDYFVWDFTSELTPCTLLPVLLQAYRYAGFGYRATSEWTKENCIMYTSEGKSRAEIDGSNARWIYVTGTTGNGKSGLLMMAYPENRKFPEPLRIWDENANNGRGDVFINFAPTKNEDWLLETGKTYKLKYRIVTYDGDMTPEKAEGMWNDFVNLPVVTQTCIQNKHNSNAFSGEKGEVKLIILAPGHFHAALVQKTSYPQVANEVSVYAPDGDELKQYLRSIDDYNSRPDIPTHWKENVYAGADFLEKMKSDKTGNVVVLAGNNQDKTAYIKAALQSGKNVFADKPMAINGKNFENLKECFKIAAEKNLILYDIMTERYEITSILQKEFSQQTGLFGVLQKGSPENPAIVKESVHHFSKQVSGKPLIRPAWFFDVEQQGEGMVDVSTHLIDLIQWACFPEQILDYSKDIQIIDANRYPTILTPAEFEKVTGKSSYPDYLKKDVKNENLEIYSNGSIIYALKDVNAKISVKWNFEAPAGGGDTHYSIMRGTKADIIIKQDREQNYIPSLYIESNEKDLEQRINDAVKNVAKKYEGVEAKKISNNCFEIIIPEKYRVGHEAHFGEVMQKYLQYLVDGKLPEWEIPNMIAKYYTTTKALELALQKSK